MIISKIMNDKTPRERIEAEFEAARAIHKKNQRDILNIIVGLLVVAMLFKGLTLLIGLF